MTSPPPSFHLRLFVAGGARRSVRTIANLHRLCEQHLGPVSLEVVDIYQQPDLAVRDHVIAAPTLVKLDPPPVRRIIGDLSDFPKVLRTIDPNKNDSIS